MLYVVIYYNRWVMGEKCGRWTWVVSGVDVESDRAHACTLHPPYCEYMFMSTLKLHWSGEKLYLVVRGPVRRCSVKWARRRMQGGFTSKISGRFRVMPEVLELWHNVVYNLVYPSNNHRLLWLPLMLCEGSETTRWEMENNYDVTQYDDVYVGYIMPYVRHTHKHN